MVSRALLIVVMLASCSFEPEYGATRYICKLDRCPEGYVCIDEVCVTGAGDAAADDGAAVADAPVPDAGGPSACDETFGGIDEYELCEETTETCTFGGFIDGTCDEMCEMFDTTCESAHDSDIGAVCESVADTGCATAHSRAMCTCVR
ncbi:MAG TPA: hypothetical protein VMZ28_05870 [Kofleriaceae bacterium]|nr:hypothetical protein [Kofleriaceae bacterium]